MIVDCQTCEVRTEAKVVGSFVASDDFAPSFKYILARCPTCSAPFLLSQEEGFGEDWEAPKRLYPAAPEDRSATFPRAIQAAYAEAQMCFRARAYTAAAIMCRKALEAICQEHGANERTLAASLKVLKDRGIVEQRLYLWAEALKDAGNEAAHDVNVVVSSEDASDLLDFTLALGEYLFTFRDKFEQFQARRGVLSSASNPVRKITGA